MSATMDPASYDYLDVKIEDGVAIIVLNRPEKLNACSPEEHDEMPRVLREIAQDDRVRSAIVTGAGKAFSVGGDFSLVERANANHGVEVPPIMESGRDLIYAHMDLEKPIIAAINGVAMGAGAAMALMCDITIAERHARISDGHIRAAVAAGDGGTLIWPMAVGMAKAKRYLLTADWISAEEAERIGLITEVVESGDSFTRAMEYARRFADGPQLALRYTKRALNQWQRLGATTSFDYSLYLEGLSFATEDCTNAITSIKETRQNAIAPDPREKR